MRILSDDEVDLYQRGQVAENAAKRFKVRSTDWLAPKVAREWLAEHLDCELRDAGASLLHRVGSMGARVRVAQMIVRHGHPTSGFEPRSFSVKNMTFPTDEHGPNEWLAQAFTTLAKSGADDALRSLWPTGDLHIVLDDPLIALEVSIVGLRIDRKSLMQAFDLPEPEPAEVRSEPVKVKAGPGTTPKWNWARAYAYVAAVASEPDGLPEGHGAQAEIARLLGQYFLRSCGKEPGETMLKAHASELLSVVDEHRRWKEADEKAAKGEPTD